MIPLRVLLLRRTTPVITVVLIAINLFTLLYENALAPYAQRIFVWRYALIPDQFHQSSLLTSMFLHGGWFHLIGNMWFLWVFGSHLEEALGAARYLAFYLISGVASALVQLFVSFGSSVPTVGASGAIAGVMGAFLYLIPGPESSRSSSSFSSPLWNSRRHLCSCTGSPSNSSAVWDRSQCEHKAKV